MVWAKKPSHLGLGQIAAVDVRPRVVQIAIGALPSPDTRSWTSGRCSHTARHRARDDVQPLVGGQAPEEPDGRSLGRRQRLRCGHRGRGGRPRCAGPARSDSSDCSCSLCTMIARGPPPPGARASPPAARRLRASAGHRLTGMGDRVVDRQHRRDTRGQSDGEARVDAVVHVHDLGSEGAHLAADAPQRRAALEDPIAAPAARPPRRRRGARGPGRASRSAAVAAELEGVVAHEQHAPRRRGRPDQRPGRRRT